MTVKNLLTYKRLTQNRRSIEILLGWFGTGVVLTVKSKLKKWNINKHFMETQRKSNVTLGVKLIKSITLITMKKQDFFVQTKIKPFLIRKDDLFICLRPLLIFGKVFGIVPLSGLFQGDLPEVRFKNCSTTAIVTCLLILLLSLNDSIAFVGFFKNRGDDPSELAGNLAPLVCYSIGLFVYVYIYRNINTFMLLAQKWRDLTLTFNREDEKLFRDINLIAGLIYTSAILENAVSHLRLFPLESKSGSDALKYYYVQSHPQWADLIPYNPLVAVLIFIFNKLTVYAWNFGDILIAVISRGIYFKFKSLTEEATLKLTNGDQSGIESVQWDDVVQDHRKLCDLVDDINSFLNPLIFASYSVNIFFVCLQLHFGLTPSGNGDIISAIYSAWSFFHLVLRAYVVSLTAARINNYAHGIEKLLIKCPNACYNINVERTERRVATTKLGIGGLNCFVITYAFILSTISVIFTFEIVLLQASTSAPSAHTGTVNNCTCKDVGK